MITHAFVAIASTLQLPSTMSMMAYGTDVLLPGEYGYPCIPGLDWEERGFGDEQIPAGTLGMSTIADQHTLGQWLTGMITGDCGGERDSNGFWDGGRWLDRSVVVWSLKGIFTFRAGDGFSNIILKVFMAEPGCDPGLCLQFLEMQMTQFYKLRANLVATCHKFKSANTWATLRCKRDAHSSFMKLDYNAYMKQVAKLEGLATQWIQTRQLLLTQQRQCMVLQKGLHITDAERARHIKENIRRMQMETMDNKIDVRPHNYWGILHDRVVNKVTKSIKKAQVPRAAQPTTSAPSCWRTPSLLLRKSESHATWRRKARH
jgi:hypothetical protein